MVVFGHEQPSVEQIVCDRLGKTNGRVRSAADLHALVHALSKATAHRLVPFSSAVLAEAGNVMLGLMSGATRPFMIELLLPWCKQVALLEPRGSPTQISRARQTELKRDGFCLAYPQDCLPPVFEYTLDESITGLPEMVATFWRTLSLAAPPLRPGMPPLNVAPIAAWLTTQSLQQKTSRNRDTCRTLALFVKGLAVQSSEEVEAQKAAGRRSKGLAAAMKQAKLAEIRARSLSADQTMMTDAQRKRAKAVQIMQQASRQRREKSTRQTVQDEQQEEQRARRREAREREQREAELERESLEKQRQAEEEARQRKEAREQAKARQAEHVDADADPWGASTDLEFRGGLEMKLADGRRVGPARLSRMSKGPKELGIPELDLELAAEKQRIREKQRTEAQAAAAAAALKSKQLQQKHEQADSSFGGQGGSSFGQASFVSSAGGSQ